MLVYLNGEFIPSENAHVSVFDRGFLFGDAVYEVLGIYEGKLLGLPYHFKRLERSLAAIGLSNPLTLTSFQDICAKLITQYDQPFLRVYCQISRGFQQPRAHLRAPGLVPTIFFCVDPWDRPDKAKTQMGYRACTVPDIRWHRCDIKATSLLANILSVERAKEIDPKAHEAVLIRDGFLTEAASSSVLVVKQDIVYLPPLSEDLLPSITRELVLKACEAAMITVRQEAISEKMLLESDGIWLASSLKELAPLSHLNNVALPQSTLPLWSKAYDAFEQLTLSQTTALPLEA